MLALCLEKCSPIPTEQIWGMKGMYSLLIIQPLVTAGVVLSY
jgi:hypothetical protein